MRHRAAELSAVPGSWVRVLLERGPVHGREPDGPLQTGGFRHEQDEEVRPNTRKGRETERAPGNRVRDSDCRPNH